MNDKLTIDPRISKNLNVVLHHEIQKYLNRQKWANWGERVLYSIVEICLAQEKSKIVLNGLFNSLNGNDIRKMKELFMNLPTWDKLGLFGKKIINGDAIKLMIDNWSYNLTRLANSERIDFYWTRNKVGGLVKALLFNNSMGHTYINGQKFRFQQWIRYCFIRQVRKSRLYLIWEELSIFSRVKAIVFENRYSSKTCQQPLLNLLKLTPTNPLICNLYVNYFIKLRRTKKWF